MVKCRACLAIGTNMVPMNAFFIKSFNLLTGLSIKISDMSLYICKTCYDAVQFFMDFREKCIESDLSFKEMLVSVTVQEIKHENDFLSDKNKCILPIVKQEMISELNDPSDSDTQNNSNNNECGLKTEHAYATRKTKTNPKKRIISNILTNKTVKEKRNRIIKKEVKRKEKEKCTDSKVHCGLCDSKFEDRNELSKHLEYHKSLFNAQVSCGLCTERFLNLPHMLGHRLEHIPEEQRVCHICSKKFTASSSTCLEYHYMRTHGMAEKDAQIQCKQCASSYVTSRKLIRHVRDCHSAPRFECRLCSKSFRNRTLLNVHNNMQHTEGKRVNCELCPFTSKYPNSLMLHTRRKHTLNTFNCKACYRVFLDEASLARHVADVCKHHARVVCTVCGHTVKKAWLKHHMRSHSDDYPFKCDVCPAQYKYRTGLKDHTDKHKGKLTFHCDLCNKSFCIKSALQSHRRTHTGDKPFVCEICKTGFKRRYNLKAHMNAHPWTTAIEQGNEKKI